jgi:hypothetical protein
MWREVYFFDYICLLVGIYMSYENLMAIIPSVVLSSDVYMDLNEKERINFLARLNYCCEVALKGADATATKDVDFISAIDDIELDAMSIMSLGDASTQVSPYQIHSSWTIQCSCIYKKTGGCFFI